jgi:hypothetical protein
MERSPTFQSRVRSGPVSGAPGLDFGKSSYVGPKRGAFRRRWLGVMSGRLEVDAFQLSGFASIGVHWRLKFKVLRAGMMRDWRIQSKSS